MELFTLDVIQLPANFGFALFRNLPELFGEGEMQGEPWAPLTTDVNIVDARRLAAGAASLEVDRGVRLEFVARRLAPNVMALEEQRQGTPVERVDTAVLGVRPLLQMTDASRARTIVAFRRSLGVPDPAPAVLDSYQTVGFLGDLGARREATDVVVATALYGEMVAWLSREEAPPGEVAAERGAGGERLKSLDTALNNCVAGLMTYLQAAGNRGAGTLVGRLERLFTLSAGLSLLRPGKSRRSPNESGVTADFFAPWLRGDRDDALRLLDRRGAVSALSGMRGTHQESAFFELVATVARHALGLDDRVPSTLFNAGVSMLRIARERGEEGFGARQRMAANALGLETALWGAGGDVVQGLAAFDGFDCLVNLAGAASDLIRADPPAGDDRLREALAATYRLALVGLTLRQVAPAEDAARLEGSTARLGEWFQGNPRYALRGERPQDEAHLVASLCLEDAEPEAVSPDDPDQRDASVQRYVNRLIKRVCPTPGEEEAPPDAPAGAFMAAEYGGKLNSVLERDFKMKEELAKDLSAVRQIAAELFNPAWLVAPYAMPELLRDEGLPELQIAWSEVRSWLADPEDDTIARGFEHLRESLERRGLSI